MLLLLIVVMPMLATLKCVVHGKTSKEKIHGISDVLLFNSYIFFVSGVLSIIALSRMSSLVYYPVEGVSSIVMLTLVNSLVFKEKISAISILGIVLGAVAIVLVNF